jgi:hypothetical protein
MTEKTFPQGLGPNWIGPTIGLVLGAVLFGSGYWLGQRSLLDVKSAQVATPPPRPPWNPGPGASPAHPLPVANIPANATPEVKEFLQNRATLNAKVDELRGQGINDAPNPQAMVKFHQQNADLLKRQSDLAKIIAQQQSQSLYTPPPPLQIPSNASPQLKTFLTARDQLTRDQIAFMDQHRNDTPDARKAAMQQWRQQNAARFKELQDDAKALAQSNPSKPPAASASAAPATSVK